MDNAGRRNFHARAACPEAGMDRQCPRRIRPMPSACRGSFADRDARPRDRFRRGSSACACNAPYSRTTHPRIRLRGTATRPDCMALPGIPRPQPGGETGRNCAAIRRIARRRIPSAPPSGVRRRQHPTPRGTARDCTGRTSFNRAAARAVTAVQAVHAAFPEIELGLSAVARARGRAAARQRRGPADAPPARALPRPDRGRRRRNRPSPWPPATSRFRLASPSRG